MFASRLSHTCPDFLPKGRASQAKAPETVLSLRPRYNVLVSTAQGTLITNRNDLGVSWQLASRGAYDPDEVELLRQVALASGLGAVVLDIGANIGVHSISIGESLWPHGCVYAFEAQRLLYYALAGNIALASLDNVFAFHRAVGGNPGRIPIPNFDYAAPLSFRSVEFGPRQTEDIGQSRRDPGSRPDFVEVVTVDSLELSRVDLAKIDVEGMELEVIAGATQTIERLRPVLFVEFLKCDRHALANRLWGWDYQLYRCTGNLFAIPPQLAGNSRVNGLERVTPERLATF
jgi:FkbM family methyltransferase